MSQLCDSGSTYLTAAEEARTTLTTVRDSILWTMYTSIITKMYIKCYLCYAHKSDHFALTFYISALYHWYLMHSCGSRCYCSWSGWSYFKQHYTLLCNLTYKKCVMFQKLIKFLPCEHPKCKVPTAVK